METINQHTENCKLVKAVLLRKVDFISKSGSIKIEDEVHI